MSNEMNNQTMSSQEAKPKAKRKNPIAINIQEEEEIGILAQMIGKNNGVDFSFVVRFAGKGIAKLSVTHRNVRKGGIVADINPASLYGM